MGYDIDDTYSCVAIELTSIISHLSQKSGFSKLKVDTPTKAMLKQCDVLIKGRGNTLEIQVAEALRALDYRFQIACNEKRDGFDIERSIQTLLTAYVDICDFSVDVITFRKGDFLTDDVQRMMGPQPFVKYKDAGRISDPISEDGNKKRFPLFVAFIDDRYFLAGETFPEAIEDGDYRKAWELLSGNSVQSLRLLTIQIGG